MEETRSERIRTGHRAGGEGGRGLPNLETWCFLTSIQHAATHAAIHAATSDAHTRSNTRSNKRRAHTRVVVYVPALSLFSNVQRHPPEREGGGLGCDVVGVAVKSPGYEEEGDSSDEGTEHKEDAQRDLFTHRHTQRHKGRHYTHTHRPSVSQWYSVAFSCRLCVRVQQ